MRHAVQCVAPVLACLLEPAFQLVKSAGEEASWWLAEMELGKCRLITYLKNIPPGFSLAELSSA
jgi:hypothetical protein